MNNIWKNWCCLCAREGSILDDTKNITLKNVHDSTFLNAVNKHFFIDLSAGDLPRNVCNMCHEFVTDVISFSKRVSKVQAMFAEIQGNNEESDLKQLRTKYELYDPNDIKLKITPPHSNIGEFEFIDEDMLNVPEIKTEQKEEDHSNTSDHEWQPEREQSSSDDDEDQSLSPANMCEDAELDEKSEKKSTKRRGRPRIHPETFTCSACQKEYITFTKYSSHMLKEHNISPEPLPFTCSKCNKSFPTQKTCSKHEATHLTAQQKLTTCPYCNKEFKKNKLRGHIRELHSGERPFVCDDCGKSYTTFGNLKEHKLTHSDESPFQCRYCEKRFKNKPRLKTHEDTHNDTNYICTSCGLQLNTRRTLNSHMLVHSDQKQHKCELCGKEYKRAKNLKIHLIMHAGLKSYMCTFCDKSFTCNANCRIHMRKNHPIELAELEASGKKISNANIPKLKDLRAVISKKSLIQELGMETVGLESDNSQKMVKDLEPSATSKTQKHEPTLTQHPSSYLLSNRMSYGHLNVS